LLERLRQALPPAARFRELHACGIAFPATAGSELNLNGYAIERVYEHGRLVGVRLVGPEPARSTRRTPAAPVAAPIASRCAPETPADPP